MFILPRSKTTILEVCSPLTSQCLLLNCEEVRSKQQKASIMFCDQTAKQTFETLKPLYILILKASLVLAICEAQAGLDLPAHAPKCQSFFLQTILFLPLCYVSRTIKEEAVVRDHYSKCLHFTEGWETSWRSPHVPGLQ